MKHFNYAARKKKHSHIFEKDLVKLVRDKTGGGAISARRPEPVLFHSAHSISGIQGARHVIGFDF